jgi:hypothetical protein
MVGGSLRLLAGFSISLGACAAEHSDPSPEPYAATLVRGQLTGNLTVTSAWDAGYCANVTATNTGSGSAVWSLVVDLGASRLEQSWSSNAVGRTGKITFSGVSWNSTLQAGGTASFGFCASGRSTPTIVDLGGGGSGGGTGTGGAGSGGSGGGAGSGGSGGSDSREHVAVIVRHSTYTQLKNEIERYRADVEARFPVKLDLLAADYGTPGEVRGAIRNAYQQKQITGAVLIGALPYQRFNMQDTNIVNPLYYEAFDLKFWDTNNDGVENRHENPANQVKVWIANIRCMVQPNDDGVPVLRRFFDKTHAYYLDPSFVERRALAMTGSDWPDGAQHFADHYGKRMYGSVDVYSSGAASLAALRSAFSQRTYGMFYIQVHSSESVQGMSDGDLYSSEIETLRNGALISINHGCSVCSWTKNVEARTSPNTCMAYVCGGSQGQAIIGQTRVGMVYQQEKTYERLLAGDYLGKAYRATKQAAEEEAYAGGIPGEYVSGMVLIGNPFLSLK